MVVLRRDEDRKKRKELKIKNEECKVLYRN